MVVVGVNSASLVFDLERKTDHMISEHGNEHNLLDTWKSGENSGLTRRVLSEAALQNTAHVHLLHFFGTNSFNANTKSVNMNKWNEVLISTWNVHKKLLSAPAREIAALIATEPR